MRLDLESAVTRGWNTKLDEDIFISLGSLLITPGFNILARTR